MDRNRASGGCWRGGDRQARKKQKGRNRKKKSTKTKAKANIAWELTTPTQPAKKKKSRGREKRCGGVIQREMWGRNWTEAGRGSSGKKERGEGEGEMGRPE